MKNVMMLLDVTKLQSYYKTVGNVNVCITFQLNPSSGFLPPIYCAVELTSSYTVHF